MTLNSCTPKSTLKEELKTTEKNTYNDDSLLWLEEVESKESIEYVLKESNVTKSIFSKKKLFPTLQKEIHNILSSKEKIPYPSRRGDFVYNLHQDAKNPKGLWRRMKTSDYLEKKENWEIILDIDQLGKKEKTNWVYKSVTCLQPKNTRCILQLSDGGKDAAVWREFDIEKKAFVPDGFNFPEAKGAIDWFDENTIMAAFAYKEAESTESGYPLQVKLIKRNENWENGKLLFEGKKENISIWPMSFYDQGKFEFGIYQGLSFYTSQIHLLNKNDLSIQSVNHPQDADFEDILENHYVFKLRKDLDTIYKQGSLVAFHKTKEDEKVLLYEPKKGESFKSYTRSKENIYIHYTKDIQSRLRKLNLKNGKVIEEEITLPSKQGTLSIIGRDNHLYENLFLNFESLLTPSTLYYFNENAQSFQKIQSEPAWFDSKDLISQQSFATSKDGTQVPYFIVANKNYTEKENSPTLLYGYGGFEVSLSPNYKSISGKAWVSKGGVYVLANIRGGGEYGPSWHQAALKTKRNKAFEDFIAVAEDLIKKKVTTPKNLGIRGGSNGGLLVGAVSMMRPELFNAVLCSVPLLDMFRYHKLLAGASWVAEYGNTEKNEDIASFWRKYSPFQNISQNKKYPEILFVTSTKDDRVHPGHARKMYTKLKELGHQAFYYENTEGGHSAASDLKERAYSEALSYSYLWEKLK